MDTCRYLVVYFHLSKDTKIKNIDKIYKFIANFFKQKEKTLQVNESLTRVLILDLQIKKPVQIKNHSLWV